MARAIVGWREGYGALVAVAEGKGSSLAFRDPARGLSANGGCDEGIVFG